VDTYLPECFPLTFYLSFLLAIDETRLAGVLKGSGALFGNPFYRAHQQRLWEAMQ